MSKCLKCGSELAPDVKFCVVCGAKIPRCPACGRVISEKSRFCTVDGTPFPADILAMLGLDAPASESPAVQPQPVNPPVPPAAPPAKPEKAEKPAKKEKPTKSAKPAKPAKTAKPAKKEKTSGGNGKIIVLAAILAVLLLVLFGVIYWFFLRDPGTNAETAVSAQETTVVEENSEEDAEAEQENTEADAVVSAYDATAEGFVQRLYVELLGREADEEGLKYWTDALESGDAKAADLIRDISTGEEFTSLNLSNEEIMNRLYSAVLGREPDAEGLEYWVDVLDNGAPLTEVVNDLTESEEFAGICAEYGIQ